MRNPWRLSLGCVKICREHLAHVRKAVVSFGEEVDKFIMAEECIHVACVSQNVTSPPVEHCELKEGCHVFGLVLQEQVAGRFPQQSMVVVGLPQPVVQVMVFAAGPDAPLSNPEQRWPAIRQ